MVYYWVGGAGNTSDATNHISTSSGGAGNAANVPTAADDLIGDENSGCGAGGLDITLDVDLDCHTINWLAITGAPRWLSNYINRHVHVNGSLKMGDMTVYGATYFLEANDAQIIQIENTTFSATIIHQATGGSYTLAHDLTVGASSVYNSFIIYNGTFDTDGYAFQPGYSFYIANTATRAVYLRDSIVRCDFDGLLIDSITGLTFDAGTSTIQFYSWTSGSIQTEANVPAGVTLYNVEIYSGTATDFMALTSDLTGNKITFIPVSYDVQVVITAGKTIHFDTWAGTGDASHGIVFASLTPGSPYYFTKPSGVWSPEYLNITDCHTSGGTWAAVNSVDNGGNAGWKFWNGDIGVGDGNIIMIQEYFGTVTAEAGTSTSVINATAHGINGYDMIVNNTRRNIVSSEEPGSRMCTLRTVDSITLNADIVGQAVGDEIFLFSYADRTSWLKVKTLKVSPRSDHMNTASFSMTCTSGGWYPRKGQEVKIYLNYNLVFGGVISVIKKTRPGIGTDNTSVINVDISCDGFNALPARRTIACEYNDQTSGYIVQDMIDRFLSQEGIIAGTIDAGAGVDGGLEYPANPETPLSVLQILDDQAATSGYKWWIDNDKTLYFVKDDDIVLASHDIDGSFTDYRDVSISESIANYRNKEFVTGGLSETSEEVYIYSQDDAEIQAQQLIEGTSGIYGKIDSNEYINKEIDPWEVAEAGTNTTNIKITGHGLVDGDVIYNVTRDARRQIIRVDADNMTVATVTGQTSSDEIIWWPDANKFLHEQLAINVHPVELSFKTYTLDFEPSTKMTVTLPCFGLDAEEFVIESVEYTDESGIATVGGIAVVVTTAQRDTAAWSTRHIDGGIEFFKKLIHPKTQQITANLRDINVATGESTLNMWTGTAAEYAALTPNEHTIYMVT